MNSSRDECVADLEVHANIAASVLRIERSSSPVELFLMRISRSLVRKLAFWTSVSRSGLDPPKVRSVVAHKYYVNMASGL
jgi:hypothetical protein